MKGSIHGIVKNLAGQPVAAVAIVTEPASVAGTTAADGTFALDDVLIGSYVVDADLTGYAPYRLAGVGVAAGVTTSVSLVLTIDQHAPGRVTGTVTDGKAVPTPLAGVVVTIEGSALTATTGAAGTFTITNVPPGPVYVAGAAPSTAYLDTETRAAVVVPPNGAAPAVRLVLSARPSDAAQDIGMEGLCSACHAAAVATEKASAHFRSLQRIARDGAGKAQPGAFAAMLDVTLTTPRIVMVPLAGTISIAASSPVVTGAGGSAFATGTDCGATPATAAAACRLAPGDELGYTPTGLVWQKLGTVATVDNDGQVTLTASATFAPAVTSLTGAKYGVKRLSRSYTRMLPQDANDIVAPAWPGVKATNPNYDANDPCIYAAPTNGTCAGGGAAKYADGQVNVYVCNLKDGVTYVNDEFVQKFGGNPYSCADAAFFNGGAAPAVPMVHIDVIYGGQGDKNASGPHKNMGVFKQRFQGRLADIKAAAPWGYTAGKAVDSLTLPIQVLESGDRVNGGYKMNGYHPTEQKFPGESWTQRTRTFSHGCSGCHNTGLALAWTSQTVTLPFGRDGAPDNSPMTFSAITSYGFADENLGCEHCHGPASEHASTGGGRGNKIINPKYLTAEAERQMCGKCHAYDDATNAQPLQDYGFEFPWNSSHAAQIGKGAFVAGVYDLGTFFDNWDERTIDDEAIWDPVANVGTLYGQAHRQQYIMLAQSTHTANPWVKTTCTSCHDPHTQYLGSTHVESTAAARFDFTSVDFRDNTLCLSCHAEGGPTADMPRTGPWAAVTKDDVANLQIAAGRAVTRNGVAVTPTSEEINASRTAIKRAVGAHMFAKTSMMATYDPTDEAMPVGRCTSCHMPKVAKSGGYITGNDSQGNKALIAGDQASHVFSVVWPWQSNALSRGGPTFQSGYYGQMISPTNVKYDLYGTMPNSCGSCHTSARTASIACPDSAALWPTYWPYSEHAGDPFWSSCFLSSQAP